MSDRVLITKSTLTRLGSSLRSKLPGADGTKTISQWASFIDDWNGGGTAAPSYTVSDCGESSCNGTYRLTPMNVASGDHGAVYAKEPTTGTDGIDCFLVASYRDDELSNGVPGVRWSIYCDGIERYYINSEAPILGEWNAVGSSSLPVPVVTCSVDMLTLESGGNDEDGVYVDTGFVLNDHPVYARLERMDTDSWYFYHDGASWSLAKGGTTLGTSSSLEGAWSYELNSATRAGVVTRFLRNTAYQPSESSSSSSPHAGVNYSGYDIINGVATLNESGVDLSDYQYNTDGLNAVPVPSGYLAVSGTKDSVRSADFSHDAYGMAINDDGNLLIQSPSSAVAARNSRRVAAGGMAIDGDDNLLIQSTSGGYEIYGSDTSWTAVAGFYTVDLGVEFGYAIRDGRLYFVTFNDSIGLVVSSMGEESDWTCISGYSASGSHCFAFGIRSGSLYSLNGSSAYRVGTDSDWTAVTGFVFSGSDYHGDLCFAYAYGIRGGMLYRLYFDEADSRSVVPVCISDDDDWTFVSGYSFIRHDGSGASGAAYGIKGGVLHELAHDGSIVNVELSSCQSVVMIEPGRAIAITGEVEEESYSSEESSSSSEESSSSSADQFVCDSYDVVNNQVFFYAHDVDMDDYQYNTDGLNAVVLPVGYKAVSGTKDSVRLADFIYGTFGIAVNGNGNLLTKSPSDGEYYTYGEDTDWTAVSGFFTDYNYVEFGYALKSGALYYVTYDSLMGLMIDRIGGYSDWTAISGYSVAESNEYCWAFGIKSGRLYSLRGTVATQLGTATNWTAVTGFAYYEETEYGYKSATAYGVAGGKLYKIYVSNYSLVVEQVGSDTDWQSISGYSCLIHYTEYYGTDSVGSAFGIRSGMIFELSNLTRIDLVSNSWYFVVMVEPNEAVALTRTAGESSPY